MKSVKDTIDALNITESAFYKHDYFRPFIQTYLTKPNLYKGKFPFKLLHNYCFGTDLEYKDFKHTYVFIGYRWLSRKFWPLFISISKYDNAYFIDGFSTYTPDHQYFETYKDLGFIQNIPIHLRIENRVDLNNMPSLDMQIKAMGEKVLKHLEVRMKFRK